MLQSYSRDTLLRYPEHPLISNFVSHYTCISREAEAESWRARKIVDTLRLGLGDQRCICTLGKESARLPHTNHRGGAVATRGTSVLNNMGRDDDSSSSVGDLVVCFG